ncbi:DNA-directed DNA polymerase II large subunit [Methanothermococcus sp.]|uniref:DNA-directed DNA polymerase II large subunit n=1 Tax=Methanothermococcus sp. TaxID=2614238 RepID=UPI0025F7986C|nr:DNA-directed DNA polymerase II large subunit [Methanothermococcus sp.]
MFHVSSSKDMESYFKNILDNVKKIYSIAEVCRKKGYDPTDFVEIPLAKDMADRVEGLVGPKGVSERIRELVSELGKEPAALEIAKEIVEGKFGNGGNREELAEQAVRTALAIITEGIVAAPLEGIAHVKIKKNKDGSEYLAIYFAGPIRSAGGTAQALAVLVGDYVRKNMGLNRYLPSEDEIERYVEEVDLYQSEVGSFQYSPKAEEMRTAVKNISIEITGEATDDVEVSGHRDLDRVETNQIRGGALLALVEGVLLKAPKILRHVDKLGIEGWDWLKELKGKKEEKGNESEKDDELKDNDNEIDNEEFEEYSKLYDDIEIEAITKFIGEVIAGRPVFAHPSKTGGFRLRYGRSRNTGFATDGFHPALMYLVDDFMAVGTQLKTERPGKATCVVPVDSIEPPIVKLKNGNVIRIDTIEKALEYRSSVEEILFLGDILVNFGDFLENNHPILPSSWCEEWYEKILISRDITYKKEFIDNPDQKEAVKFAIETETPLHPRYTYHWHDVSKDDILLLRKWILSGYNDKEHDIWLVPYNPKDEESVKAKRILELIGCCHNVLTNHNIGDNKDNAINKYISIDEYYPLLYSMGYDVEKNQDSVDDINEIYNKSKNPMHLINLLAPFEIKRKAYIYIGARMGRPEKAAARKMKPPVNGLFPIGNAGNVVRLINKAVEEGKTGTIEVSYGKCPKCGKISLYNRCPFCGTFVELSRPNRVELPLKDYWYKALENLKINKPGDVKCIKGMTSKDKIVEPLEKAILRAMNNVFVFKDGTLRFDCTDVPITHFKPCEINVSIEKLKELGYDKDIDGNPITNENQVIELKVQDVIIPNSCAEYFVNATKFIDDLLEKFYKTARFYNVKNKEDLIGHLVIGMAPHTSAGMVGRIIGYCKANVGYAHPYFHASKRRNCFPPNTSILVNINGEVKRITIEELYNLYNNEYYKNMAYIKKDPKNNNNIKVYSFDTLNKKIVLTDIEEVLKIPSPNHLINIELDTGRSFETTPDHPVMIYNEKEDKFIKKNAMDVEENDLMLIPKLDFEEEDIEYIDLLEELSKDEYKNIWELIRVRGISDWIINNILKDCLNEKSENGKEKLIKNITKYIKQDTIPLNLLLKILKNAELNISDIPKDIFIAVKRDKVNIKRIIKIEPLLKIIGYYLAEGYVRKTSSVYQINFSNYDEEVNKDLKNALNEAFGNGFGIYERDGKITVGSRIIHLLFTEILKTGTNTHNKRVPSFIFKLPKEKVKLILSAYFTVDGSAVKTRPIVVIYSANKKLLEDIDTLMISKFGLYGNWGVDKNANGRRENVAMKYHEKRGTEIPKSTVYRIDYNGIQAMKYFENIGFTSSKKQNIYELHTHKNFKAKKGLKEYGCIVKVRNKTIIKAEDEFVYSLNAKKYHNVVINSNIQTYQCDGDEDAIFLLLDAFLNFSKRFLPDKRGGQMDAPLVLTTLLDPKEVDGEVHNMDTVWEYPLEFYEKTLEMPSPKEVKELIETVEDRLGTPSQYEGIGYTHETSCIDAGPLVCAYKTLGSMLEKTEAQLAVAKKIRATDERDVAEKVIQSHFIPDLIGNLRAFSRQSVRCKCGAKFRRVPLKGVCPKCGSKLILTVSKGAVEKYMEVSQKMAEKYNASDYIKQRLELIKEGIDNLFENDKNKQVKIEDFFKKG